MNSDNDLLKELDWDGITYTISNQQCILLLGAEASLEKVSAGPDKSEKCLPSVEILANRLASEICSDIKKCNISPNDLRHVAQSYLISRGIATLRSKVKDFYSDPTRCALTCDMHRQLAKLPFNLIITTTFYNMMVNALQEVGKLPQEDFFDVSCREARELVKRALSTAPWFIGSMAV